MLSKETKNMKNFRIPIVVVSIALLFAAIFTLLPQVYSIVCSALLIIAILVFLPKILSFLGLHPHYTKTEYSLAGKRALIVTTSHDKIDATGKKTGVYASEMTVPYYEFLDAKVIVDIASIKGGKIPIEPISISYPIATQSDKRFLKDKSFQDKVNHSLKIEDVDITIYDLVFIAGGWGAAYDLGYSDILGQKITNANAEGKILGSVCHGALGFAKATKANGDPLVKGKKITGVTNKQIKELNITSTPMHPETALRELGADYQSQKAFPDLFANLIVVDGNIVSGQNQNAGGQAAQSMLALLNESVSEKS